MKIFPLNIFQKNEALVLSLLYKNKEYVILRII